MNRRPTPTVPNGTQKVFPNAASPQGAPRSAEIVEEIDRLLDEIDAVLEDQADLADFRQQPGQ
ncbi:MAG: hypothetical protein QOD57_3116 [Actinomycetota bacterium]|jgi:hypothetical protein|nr:hypothetical protein [Actinomycetota bacterium]